MSPTVPIDSLMRFLQAAPEQRAAIDQFLLGGAWPEAGGESRVRIGESRVRSAECGVRGEGGDKRRFLFRKAGRVWEVVFEGSRPFHLENTLGARYLDYLLHHPNEPIAAFDLEVAVQPEKGEARSANSIQPQIDGRARREYERALRELRMNRERAERAGDRERVGELEADIKTVESALNQGSGTTDTGERARSNVRKALEVVSEKLRQGGREEQAFAEHLRSQLSTGYECLYSQPHGQIWD